MGIIHVNFQFQIYKMIDYSHSIILLTGMFWV
jgi:hypothetical protein